MRTPAATANAMVTGAEPVGGASVGRSGSAAGENEESNAK